MYYWKTNKLAKKLKNNEPNQAEYKNYYIASSVLTLVGFYLANLEPPKTSHAVLFEAICSILITIIGLNTVFKANGGNSGVSYLNRVISLSFPLLIKILMAGFVLGIALETLRQLGVNSERIDWLYSSSIIFIQIVFFWRIKVHVQYINA